MMMPLIEMQIQKFYNQYLRTHFKQLRKTVLGLDKLVTELPQTGDEIKIILYKLLCQIYKTGKIP